MRNIQYLQCMCIIHTFERTVCVLDQYTRVQLCVNPRAPMFSKYFSKYISRTVPDCCHFEILLLRDKAAAPEEGKLIFDCLIFQRWPIVIYNNMNSLIYPGRLCVHGQFSVRDYWWYWMALNSLPITILKIISLAR